jgi:hypothetical protein
MFKLRIILVLCVFFMGKSVLYSQGNIDPYQNRVIGRHYSTKELNFLEMNNREKFNKIKYYYIHSFSVSAYPTPNAQVFDLSLVDVREFESYRLKNESITVLDSLRGFKITLISQRQLEKMFQTNVIPQDGDIKNSGFKKTSIIVNPYFILSGKNIVLFDSKFGLNTSDIK